MKEEKVTEGDIKKVYLQSISFETLLKIVNGTDRIGSLYMFSMPNHIKSYTSDVEKTTQSIFSIFENEDERWRIKAKSNVDIVSNDEYIIFDGNNKILDADLCICMPIVNSIFVIPGPESIKSGWDVTKIVQFTNLISLTPMLLRLTDVEDEENPPNHKISVSYEVIEKKK